MEQNKDHSGAAVRGEAVAEFAYKGADGKFLDSGAWWVDNSEISCHMALPILRNGEVIAMVFAEAIDGCKEAIEENCRLLCAAANSSAPVSARAANAPSEPSELAQELRTGADAAQHRFPGYAAVMRRAADALDSQPTEPTGYVRISELKKLESNRVAGVGMMVQKEGGDGWTPIYASSQPTDVGVRK